MGGPGRDSHQICYKKIIEASSEATNWPEPSSLQNPTLISEKSTNPCIDPVSGDNMFRKSFCSITLFAFTLFSQIFFVVSGTPYWQPLAYSAMPCIPLHWKHLDSFFVSKEHHVCIQMYSSGHTMHISMTTPFLLCMQRQPSGISPICQRLRRVGKGVDFPSWSSSDFHCQEVIFVASKIRSPVNTPSNTSKGTTSQVVHSFIAAMWHDLSKFQRVLVCIKTSWWIKKPFNTITWRKRFLSTLYTV